MTICVHLYNFAHFRKKIEFNRNCGICRGKSFNHIFAFPVSVLVTLWLSSQATVYTCVICKLICHCLHFRHPSIWFGPAFHRLQFKIIKKFWPLGARTQLNLPDFQLLAFPTCTSALWSERIIIRNLYGAFRRLKAIYNSKKNMQIPIYKSIVCKPTKHTKIIAIFTEIREGDNRFWWLCPGLM